MKKMEQKDMCLTYKTLRTFSLLAFAVVITAVGLFSVTNVSEAANPPAGTLNSTGPNVTWDGTGIGPAAPNGESDCTTLPTSPCDEFELTIGGTVNDWTNKRARVQINWVEPATDYDMYIYKGTTLTGTVVGSSANGTTTFEQVDINPASTGVGLYTVRVVYFAATIVDQYSGIASAVSVPAPFEPPPSTCAMTSYSRHNPPCSNPAAFKTTCADEFDGYNDAGEPSIGVNWNTGNVLFLSYIHMLRTTFDDTTSPASSIWASFNPINQPTSLDPIMFTDPSTGRTIPGQLVAAGGTSLTAITDNDGESFTPNVSTGVTSGVDHQTIGAGPYNRNPIDAITGLPTVQVNPTTSYPNAWYYASQDIGAATATRSDDGGLTYGPAVPMYNLVQCSGLHGHVKVAPDGTVYVPNKNCPDPDMNAATLDGGQGFAVSEDNGLTWKVRTLPGSGSGDNDPAVGIGAGGRVFFVYTGSDKHIRVAISDDKGATFKFDQDLGLSTNTPTGVAYNIKASVFPAAVGGDNNRAALFFHGTDSLQGGDPTGDDSGATPFAGTWYPYIATTCNGGMSWTVVRADDPVQQGVVCTSGTTCPSGTRNLLDFMDIQVDRFGRPVAGYADGCVTGNCLNAVNGTKAVNDKAQVTTILRQLGGPRLFSDFDTNGPAAPLLPPPVEVEKSRRGYDLSWLTPDDNGADITSYRIYRGIGDKAPAFIGEVKAKATSFKDQRVQTAFQNKVYYQVTAVNRFGESPRTRKFFANETSQFSRMDPKFLQKQNK